MTESKNTRNPNIEFLRILAMLMIVMLHVLGKGGLLKDMYGSGNPDYVIAWVFESLSACAVNLYVLISGYFLVDSKFKSGRVLELVAEMLFYGVVIFTVAKVTGIGDAADFYTLLRSVLPLHMNTYWFMTCYILMYLLMPVLAAGVKNLNQKQHGIVLILLLIYECVFKSILPVSLEGDEKGYSLLWFLILFLLASYVRRYGLPFIDRAWKGILIYFISAALILAERYVIEYVSAVYGKLELLKSVSINYNHIFVLAAAYGLFAWGLKSRPWSLKAAKIIGFLSPMTLGVYLIHEHISLRYEWQEWLKVTGADSLGAGGFLIRILGAALCVYIVCSVADYLRILLFKGVKHIFKDSKLTQKLKSLDRSINGIKDKTLI